MKIYTGEELQRYLEDNENGYRCLSAKEKLDKYVHSKSRRVMCIYGLRETGKTTLMEQEMRDINDPEHTLYILCSMDQQGTYAMHDLHDILKEYKDCRYIFIDEITRIGNFIDCSSFLANIYSNAGRRVVVTGADTYSFSLAERDPLFDRIEFLETTFISFSDYQRLLGRDIKDYIMTGGCFGNTFEKGVDPWGYIGQAVIDNIIHSQDWCRNEYISGRSFGLPETFERSEAIKRVLITLNALYVKDKVTDILGMRGKEAVDRIIREASIPDSAYDKILTALKEIDVIKECGNLGKTRLVFLQPGMRYSLSMSVIDDVLSDVASPSEKAEYRNALSKAVQGLDFVEMIYYQIMHVFDISFWSHSNMNVTGVETEYGNVDLLIEDFRKEYDYDEVGEPDCDEDFARLAELSQLDTSAAIQTILSDSPDKGHWTKLYDDRVMQQVRKKSGIETVHKAVIYTGRSMPSPYGEGYYINAGELFNHTEKVIDELLRYIDRFSIS